MLREFGWNIGSFLFFIYLSLISIDRPILGHRTCSHLHPKHHEVSTYVIVKIYFRFYLFVMYVYVTNNAVGAQYYMFHSLIYDLTWYMLNLHDKTYIFCKLGNRFKLVVLIQSKRFVPVFIFQFLYSTFALFICSYLLLGPFPRTYLNYMFMFTSQPLD